MANNEAKSLEQTSPSNSASALIPVGVWIRVELPGLFDMVGFTYVDSQAGFSAQGWKVQGTSLDHESRTTVRLPMPGMTWQRLDAEEVRLLALESVPSWVAEFYGPQPKPGSLWGGWREHPSLKGRFLPEHPDDLQVLVHDGGPRITRNPAEVVWVTINGMDGEVFRGCVLNKPHHLRSVQQGSEIKFVVADGADHPIMVTDKYLRERDAWLIHPCSKCGLAELFDAPSDLIRIIFPNTPPDAQMSMFTSFCPLCGGVQGVEAKESVSSDDKHVATTSSEVPAKRPWWRFWG